MAHRNSGLTSRLSQENLIRAKDRWEKLVEKQDVETASRNAETSDIDFVNIPRITELALNIFNASPDSPYSEPLKDKGILDQSGLFNMALVDSNHNDRAFPFHFGKAFIIALHYFDIFKQILTRINFINLEDSLNVSSVKNGQLEGTYCFYVGGLYGKRPKLPMTSETPPVKLWFKRRCFYVEWLIDPRFMTSMTSMHRLSERTVYLIYGKIRNGSEKNIGGKDYIHFDIRPYACP